MWLLRLAFEQRIELVCRRSIDGPCGTSVGDFSEQQLAPTVPICVNSVDQLESGELVEMSLVSNLREQLVKIEINISLRYKGNEVGRGTGFCRCGRRAASSRDRKSRRRRSREQPARQLRSRDHHGPGVNMEVPQTAYRASSRTHLVRVVIEREGLERTPSTGVGLIREGRRDVRQGCREGPRHGACHLDAGWPV